MPTLAVANQKGGVGKTATAVNLGAALAERGRKVLLIDFDPQGSLTTSLGLEADRLPGVIYQAVAAFLRGQPAPRLGDLIVPTQTGCDLVPSDMSLSAAEVDLLATPHSETILRELLAGLERPYDFILIDCLPSLGMLTIAALAAADQVLIPLQAEYLAMKGLRLLLSIIARVQAKLNPQLRIAGVVFTMVESRTLHAREVLSSVREVLGHHLHIFTAAIPRTVRIKEAAVAGVSVLQYASFHPAAQAYRELAAEVEQRTAVVAAAQEGA
jgi:chromosome partitioning protein